MKANHNFLLISLFLFFFNNQLWAAPIDAHNAYVYFNQIVHQNREPSRIPFIIDKAEIALSIFEDEKRSCNQTVNYCLYLIKVSDGLKKVIENFNALNAYNKAVEMNDNSLLMGIASAIYKNDLKPLFEPTADTAVLIMRREKLIDISVADFNDLVAQEEEYWQKVY